ncbi:hypothetical protein RB601_007006 [Gaeumannomyces tritici]
MVKPLTFKGDKKPKKRKRTDEESQARKQQVAAQTQAEDEDASNDDSWVSAEAIGDVTGPIIFVLPTEPPSALACDANGKVFTLALENIVEGNPTSAEPHDVRQVWVANKVAGTENFRFKGHHGKYLGCDKLGILSATADAVSPLESFILIPTPDSPATFQVQTLRDTFVVVKQSASAKAGPEVRGDGSDISFETTLRIRMQARFKPRIKVSKEEKAREGISRKELEEAVGRRLEDDEVKVLKRARREGDYHEQLLDFKVKNKHDKYG